jgi:hypothetical protein
MKSDVGDISHLSHTDGLLDHAAALNISYGETDVLPP